MLDEMLIAGQLQEPSKKVQYAQSFYIGSRNHA